MAKRAAAGSKAKSDNPTGDDFRDRWRAALRAFALALWREGADGTPAARPDPDQLAPLRTMADEALGFVETFTLGALAQTRLVGTVTNEPPEAFLAQLGLVLKALEPSVVGRRARGARPRR